MSSPSTPLEHFHHFLERGGAQPESLIFYLGVLWHSQPSKSDGWRGATLDDMQRITPWLERGRPETLTEIWRMLVDTTRTEARAKESGAIDYFMQHARWPQKHGALKDLWTDLLDLSEGKRQHSQQVDRMRLGWRGCVSCFEERGFAVPADLAEKVANLAIAFSVVDTGHQQQLGAVLKDAVIRAGSERHWVMEWARAALDEKYTAGAHDTLAALLDAGANIQQAQVRGNWTPIELVAWSLARDDQPGTRARLDDLLELGADWTALAKGRELERAWEHAQQHPVVRRTLLAETVEPRTDHGGRRSVRM